MNVLKSYPPTTPADSVRVFAPNDSIPAPSELLGKIDIAEIGFSAEYSYSQLLDIARKKTSETGGNAFAVTEHNKSDLVSSSCHQVKGDMFRLIDPAFRGTEEIAAIKKIVKDSLPRNTFYMSAGFSFILSGILVPAGTTNNPKTGFGYSAGYRWMSSLGIGFGILYAGHRSVLKVSDIKDVITINYIAPELVLSQRHKRCILTETIGVGYAGYSEKADLHDARVPSSFNRSGIGIHLSFGFEYMIMKEMGIGASAGFYTCHYSKIEGEEEFDSAGIARLSLSAGVNFHF